MAKYGTAFKLKVAKIFLTGDGGAQLLARHRKMPKEQLRSWVCHHRIQGPAGLAPKHSSCSAKFKMQVLAWRLGQGPARLITSVA